MDIEATLNRLTLQEKASLCSGADAWSTKAIERLGVPRVVVADGPHGVRKAQIDGELTLDATEPATCFPPAVNIAATWNRDPARGVGQALGWEARTYGVDVLLGPGLNIKRHPLCGRNFEYFSEDPFFSGELAGALVRGMADEGTGACLKHFAANNQELRRMTINAVVDERTLREIYLTGFEIAVEKGSSSSVMAAYNRLNGEYCSENDWLISRILREEWGFDGIVMTDWGACNDRVAGVRAGLDLEMPGNSGVNDAVIVEALDVVVRRMLEWIATAAKSKEAHPPVPVDWDDHHQLARRAAVESFVLLKNDGGLLPIEPGTGTTTIKIAVIGAFAEHPRFQGAGSSQINARRVDDVPSELEVAFPEATVDYSPGYILTNDPEHERPEEDLIVRAESAAREADVALVFAGLPDAFESEGFDRTHMRLPESHNVLIQRVAAVQPRSVVILSNGSPVEMPWMDDVPAILEKLPWG